MRLLAKLTSWLHLLCSVGGHCTEVQSCHTSYGKKQFWSILQERSSHQILVIEMMLLGLTSCGLLLSLVAFWVPFHIPQNHRNHQHFEYIHRYFVRNTMIRLRVFQFSRCQLKRRAWCRYAGLSWGLRLSGKHARPNLHSTESHQTKTSIQQFLFYPFK